MGVPVSRNITLWQECAGFDQALPELRPSRAKGDTKEMQECCMGLTYRAGSAPTPLGCRGAG